METQDTKQDGAAPTRRILLLTTAATLALVALMVLYTRHGGGVLARLEVSVGEVLMEEGRRFQDAGALANARERYERALDSRFEGPQNRAATEKRLGQLLYDEGDFAEALPHLEAATLPPHTQINAFELRVESLIALEQWDALPPVLEAWREAADAQERPDQAASAGYYAGQLAMHHGDLGAAETAYEDATALVPGGRSAAELAWLYFQRENYAESIRAVDAYFSSGAPGNRVAWMRDLRELALTAQKDAE